MLYLQVNRYARILLSSFLFCLGTACLAQGSSPQPNHIVCLGDSITDGNTYPLIIMQSFKEAGILAPACICAGVGGDTSRQMDACFDKTVSIFKPDLVTVSAGTNDILQNVPAEFYAASIRSIVAKTKAIGAQVMLLTPCEIVLRSGNTEG